jgi:hypothetical protein
VEFEDLLLGTVKIIFWDVTVCNLGDRHSTGSLEESYCFILRVEDKMDGGSFL